MISMIWVVLFLALTGSQCGYGLPVRPTPQDYPHDGSTVFEGWAAEGALYAVIPALALVVTGLVLVFGCTWCYRHKDCKLFPASAQQLHAAAQRVQPPDSGFSEPVNNNISEDNNNGPISLREMQNIANNNAAAYIVSENEERNRVSRESVVEFEPLPNALIGVDPLERCADWFDEEDFPRNNLQYLREIGRGWFGRVVEGEIEEAGASTTVAVKILNQNATLEDKARFLDEAKVYRDITHENILAFIGKCLQEDPWILMFELCTMDLQQYLIVNRPKMALLNENGVPLRLMCDVSSALAYLHSRGHTYGRLWGGSVLVRGQEGEPRAVLGRYSDVVPEHDCFAPEVQQGALYTTGSEIWSLGTLIWEVCSWGSVPTGRPSPPPDLPCPYKSHLYQVMQLCWNGDPSARPTAAQVHALISHLHATHSAERAQPQDYAHFEDRWQRLKPNTIPKVDEHVAIVHAPSTNPRFDFDHNTLGIGTSAAVSRSSSIMSDRDPLALHVKSESLTNLHGSLDDVRNIYLTHNETAALECHQGNIHLEDSREKDQDRSDASMDPWLKDIIAGSQDDVSYYKDVSDVIKNLDNILNSEKTSSSESSHQASPSRDNLSLDCKKEYPMQSSLVKSPGITNFQNILDTGFAGNTDGECVEDEVDRDTIGTLSHSFERHSDSTSQHTLENLTPDTPMRDFEVFLDIERQATDAEVSEIESQIKSTEGVAEVEEEVDAVLDLTEIASVESVRDTELPIEVIERSVPELKELCAASMPSVSDNEQSPRKDCQTPCDNVTEIRTEDETKSIDDVREVPTDSMPLEVIKVTDSVNDHEQTDVQEVILPMSADETTISNEVFDTLPSVTEDVSTITQENDTSLVKLEDIGPESIESEYNYSKDETILISDLVDTLTDSSKDELKNQDAEVKVDVVVDLEPVTPKQMPVSVQNITDMPCQIPADLKQTQKGDSKIIELLDVTPTHLPPEIVQNTDRDAPVPETDNLVRKEVVEEKIECVDIKDSEVNNTPRSDSLVVDIKERSDATAECMDLINDTNSQILKDSTIDNNVKEVELKENSGAETTPPVDDSGLSRNDSTQYLDLPSFDMIKKTSDFIKMEIMNTSQDLKWKLVASTPKGSDTSVGMFDSVETVNEDETMVMNKTIVVQCEPGTSAELQCLNDNVSPFESPSHKSHQTDTYDENSSVVLGPFENCTELFKSAKPIIDPVELPREELLAFSSNFSEINLETPSPLRDGNFLNEVPDIIPDAEHFDDIVSISEPKDVADAPSEDTATGSGTQKHVSPSTPPNSPGISLASTSQQKYLVDIDFSGENAENDSSVRSIDLNQIELQITSKLAMAENENNLNIEYSGPLTVEGLIEESGMPETDAVPEYYLAGNGGSVEDVRELLSLDEECVKALRNELELKLPLAQVAAIEPADEAVGDGETEGEAEWGAELPPPPELVVSYPGALSPIQEETGPQLSAYENDTHWNPSTRTDSSESYPEPCNNSTDSATSLPRGDTYTVPSKDLAHTLNRFVPDICQPSSRELTMSADSLNGSPYKSHTDLNDPLSPINDRTYTKEEHDTNCEHISQVSPFLVSPTTDTDTADNATRVSTLSHTTLPTDAKLSKPTDTQCLSKATSIDSWCSNDTLYNLEENFDDLVMDAELADPCDMKDEGNSDSTDTLTHNEDDRETSHCSTYLIHESRSEPCETFSPDSIACDDRTYTKTKPEAAATPSDIENSKNTPTKDLAYGTLMSGLPSFSNCSAEAAGMEDAWRLPQPELVRRSPLPDLDLSPPKNEQDSDTRGEENSSPRLATERRLSKMESVDISCLQDDSMDDPHGHEMESRNVIVTNDSPKYRDIVPSLTSTPFVEPSDDLSDAVAIPFNLPQNETGSSDNFVSVPNFETFQVSVEARPQDLDSEVTSHQESEALLEGESATLSRNSLALIERSPTSGVENSDANQHQEQSSREKSSQSMGGNSSEEFRKFENSMRSRPQDLSSLIDASSRLLYSERMLGELSTSRATAPHDHTSHSNSNIKDPMQSLDISPPSITNLIESHELVDTREPSSAFLINFDIEDESEQPHSIIVTEVPTSSNRISPNRPYDAHMEANLLDFNHTYQTHDSTGAASEDRSPNYDLPKVNGESYEQLESLLVLKQKSPEIEERSFANNDITTLEGDEFEKVKSIDISNDKPLLPSLNDFSNGSTELPETEAAQNDLKEIHQNGSSEKYATVSFLNETFEELIESSVDDSDSKDDKLIIDESPPFLDSKESDLEEKIASPVKDRSLETSKDSLPSGLNSQEEPVKPNGVVEVEGKITTLTDDFLQNEKKYATVDSYFPLLSDIRFTGPASEMMSTSFQDSPTSPISPECEQDSKPDMAAEILKDWDSDSDSHSSNSSSGEFIWKDGDGHETSVVPSTHFDHQRGSSGPAPGGNEGPGGDGDGSGASEGSGDSGSGSEGDEVEFVPSSWDCRAAPAKSSLRSLEATPESKKRVVFKRQKYHCVYEYPREAADAAPHSPAYLPDLSTYCEWDPTSAEEAELCYGQLFSSPSALGVHYPMRVGGPFGPDYDEDFFISSSARPFESLGIMSTTSQFFPGGMTGKRALLERSLSDEGEFPAPPSPPATTVAPSLDFTTPDSGVEDITPGSTLEEELEPRKEAPWRPLDSASSSESVSPSSPGSGGELGGLRHTRDRLKLDLPPSPHAPSPRHARVFNFTLAPPKRRPEGAAPATPLVMTDETPVARDALPVPEEDAAPLPEPTFSTFGKSAPRLEPEQKLILTDESADAAAEGPSDTAKGEGTVLDSGDEDSGIESSSKATLERNAPNVS